MPSPLQQLENNEAVLLMYAANELPPEDRAEVEQMLAIDGGMRAELSAIRASLLTVENGISDLDSITRLPMSTSVALRRLAPAFAEWQLQRIAPPSPSVPAPTLRYAWWVYPVASAAAILLAAVVWWGVRGDDVSVGTTVALQPDSVPGTPDQLAERDGHMRGPGDGSFFRGPGGPGGFAGFGGGGVMQMDAADPELSDAEQQVATLTRRGDDQASTSSIFMTDAQND